MHKRDLVLVPLLHALHGADIDCPSQMRPLCIGQNVTPNELSRPHSLVEPNKSHPHGIIFFGGKESLKNCNRCEVIVLNQSTRDA